MTEQNTGPSRIAMSGRRVEGRGASGADATSKSLRFVLHKLEIGEQGLRGTLPDGSTREVPFAQITRVTARQLPPDPPWEAALFLDIASSVDGGAGPMRVFGTTTVNYAAIPGGSTSSRLDNTRRLAGFLKDRSDDAAIDEGTLEFIKGPKVPPRFANMTQFIEYDATSA
jgi:hypothetical protein